jgi:hypothetical protein
VEQKARVNNCYSDKEAAADSFGFVVHLYAKRIIGTECYYCVQGEYIVVEREIEDKNKHLNIQYNYILKYIYNIPYTVVYQSS